MVARRIELALLVALACGGTAGQNDAGTLCTPNSSIACNGDDGCSGTTTCNVSGTAVGACVCEGFDASQPDAASDAGVDTSAEADAAPWSPKALGGLCVWLDDTVGITLSGSGFAQSWSDQSGLGNDAFAGGQGVPLLKNAINKT